MKNRHISAPGFSLIELLLVLALIGIISAIAIPSFLGQRRRAAVIGDAITNAKALAMILESRKAETGVYATAGTYTWKADGSSASGPTLVPTFQTVGNTKMDYTLTVAPSALIYTITVTDPKVANREMYQTDQTGAQLYRLN